MTNANDPAMPIWFEGNLGQMNSTGGLTKRELFAAMAMQGLLSNSPDWDKNEIGLNWVSQASMKYADALINELNKS